MIEIRRLGPDDIDAVARILFDSFSVVYRQRGHSPPFPTIDSAAWLCRAYLDLDPEGCALAHQLGQPVGVGFAHLRGEVASIGPIAARPGGAPGIGRALMGYFRELTRSCKSVRLFQDSFNPDSFGFYLRLGYSVVDVAPYLLADRLTPPESPAPRVRAATAADREKIERYDLARTGAARARDLALLASTGSALVVEEQGALAGYMYYRSLPVRVIIGPAVSESPEILAGLLDAVAAALPGRAAVIRGSAAAPAVLRRAFQRGFRVDHLGNLMVTGEYRSPPAQLYSLFPESL
jgi:hypothetical protein